MALTKFVSMELDDEDSLDMEASCPGLPDKPKWPYGLRICLTGPELDKLGVDCDDYEIGDLVETVGLARVTSISKTEMEGGPPQRRVELQIEQISVEEPDENEAAEGPGEE